MGYWEGNLPCEGEEALVRLPRAAVPAPSLKVPRVRLDWAWSNLDQWNVSLPCRDWNKMYFKVPSHRKHPLIP